ncbi:MAG TPA: diguanylate cyclase [Polyangiaceae bacterium]
MSSSSAPPPIVDGGHESESVSGATWLQDLRGPLGVIRGQVRILLDGSKGGLNDDQRRSASAIERQAQKLGRLLAKLEAWGPPTPPSERAFPSGVFSLESLASPPLLIADDDDEILEVLSELLSSRYQLTLAKDGGEALAALRSQVFHLAIVDLNLPVLDGFGIVQALRASGDREPAFMFLSAQTNPQTKVRALSLGAADYVTKPFDPDELTARIARIVASVTREASLRADALTDPLTGLANYRSLAQSLEREIERSRRYGHPLSLITLDLDHLKTINDEHGHDAGNEAIRLVAEVLKRAVRSFDVVARQGGDEFAVLLPNTSSAEAEHLAHRLRGEITAQILHGMPLSASIGVASREKSNELEPRALVKASDEALYRAKYAGRNRVEVARRDAVAPHSDAGMAR